MHYISKFHRFHHYGYLLRQKLKIFCKSYGSTWIRRCAVVFLTELLDLDHQEIYDPKKWERINNYDK